MEIFETVIIWSGIVAWSSTHAVHFFMMFWTAFSWTLSNVLNFS